jgi:hypothetical protein
MLVSLAQPREIVYTVRCGVADSQRWHNIYGNRMRQYAIKRGCTHPERVSLPDPCFHSTLRAKVSYPALRQVVHMRHLFWTLQRRPAIQVSMDLLATQQKRLKFKGI